MSATNRSDNRDDEDIYTKNLPEYTGTSGAGGMTPSIIKTINNTSPTPPSDNLISYNGNTLTGRPYESYIEDSFVGHWEREDDDSHDEHLQHDRDNLHNIDDEDSAMHPSTIEFDFDSFGPESIIYAPSVANANPVTSISTANPSSNNNNSLEVLDKTTTPEIANPVADVETKPETNKIEVVKEEPVPKQTAAATTTTATFEELKPQNIEQLINITEADIASNPRIYSPSPDEYLVDSTQIDLRVIEPYKKVISHAGYCHHYDPSIPAPKPGEPAPAIIVFSACYLPDRSRRDYDYVMDHLFLYVLSSLHELIADDYILIYLHNTQPSIRASGTSSTGRNNLAGEFSSTSNSTPTDEPLPSNNLPTFTWMKRCYQMIDRKLRKNLKILYLVKPTFWLKTIVIMCKPFISTKFSKKLKFIEDMNALRKCIPVDKLIMPASAQNI